MCSELEPRPDTRVVRLYIIMQQAESTLHVIVIIDEVAKCHLGQVGSCFSPVSCCLAGADTALQLSRAVQATAQAAVLCPR